VKKLEQLALSEKILILAPHTDDAEWGCGASISKWIRTKNEVHQVAFSAAEESVPRGLDPNITRQEFLSANKILGIPEENTTVLDYPVRQFPSLRQDIIENWCTRAIWLDDGKVIADGSASKIYSEYSKYSGY